MPSAQPTGRGGRTGARTPIARSATGPGDLGGATVMSFESRRASEMEGLVRRHGGIPIVAPSMCEVRLSENHAVLDLLRRLERREVETAILLTGVGVRALAAMSSETHSPERLAELLEATTLVARGPKPVPELRKLGLVPQVRVPEPNTWREVLASLDAEAPVAGRRVAVLEHGAHSAELVAGLEERGATVLPVPLYRWALPEDQRPLRRAVARLAAGSAEAALFTAGAQVDHVMGVAEELGLREAVLDAGRALLVASIGPVCSEALRRHGLAPDLEPEHPKMGHLVVAVARHFGRRAREARALRRLEPVATAGAGEET